MGFLRADLRHSLDGDLLIVSNLEPPLSPMLLLLSGSVFDDGGCLAWMNGSPVRTMLGEGGDCGDSGLPGPAAADPLRPSSTTCNICIPRRFCPSPGTLLDAVDRPEPTGLNGDMVRGR